jgi:anti-anti-sigma regulatory factor
MVESVPTRSSAGNLAASSGDAIQCPEILEGDAVRQFLSTLQSAIAGEHPMVLHADRTRRVSTLALQVLASAQASAKRHRLQFAIRSPSPEFERACADTDLGRLLSQGD